MVYAFSYPNSHFWNVLEGLGREFLNLLWPFGIICGHLLSFMPIWYNLWSFVIFSPFLVHRNKKNLATLEAAKFWPTWRCSTYIHTLLCQEPIDDFWIYNYNARVVIG
jgi:hypothetical protein